MAEMFMGIAIEGDKTSINEFNFTTSYLNDAIDAIILSVGGQFDYKNIKDQINYFVKLFNAQFTPVIESVKKILEKEKPDVVSVCVPNFLHKEFCALALKHNANVLCEKPLALTKEEQFKDIKSNLLSDFNELIS